MELFDRTELLETRWNFPPAGGKPGGSREGVLDYAGDVAIAIGMSTKIL
jgi:hypothetical protein